MNSERVIVRVPNYGPRAEISKINDQPLEIDTQLPYIYYVEGKSGDESIPEDEFKLIENWVAVGGLAIAGLTLLYNVGRAQGWWGRRENSESSGASGHRGGGVPDPGAPTSPREASQVTFVCQVTINIGSIKVTNQPDSPSALKPTPEPGPGSTNKPTPEPGPASTEPTKEVIESDRPESTEPTKDVAESVWSPPLEKSYSNQFLTMEFDNEEAQNTLILLKRKGETLGLMDLQEGRPLRPGIARSSLTLYSWYLGYVPSVSETMISLNEQSRRRIGHYPVQKVSFGIFRRDSLLLMYGGRTL